MLSTPLAIGLSLLTCGDYFPMDRPSQLARAAISKDAAVADAAIAELRAMGPDGLETLVDAYEGVLDEYASSFDAPGRPATPLELRVAGAVDAVGAQRDNFIAQLYWHTDFEAAKDAARENGKPILSLHLLGRLDEEYSCANSRFFRTAVYNHTEVARSLRDNFVLHWETVRPIPEITIDFGDGRTIHRTITGNSCHFILDADGRPIDAIPGLYGPRAFLDEIEAARVIHTAIAGAQSAARVRALMDWHQRRIDNSQDRWTRDLMAVGVKLPRAAEARVAPDALAAAPLAVTKAAIEVPMVTRLIPAHPSFDVLDRATDAETWRRVAARRLEHARLDDGGRRLMRKKHGFGAQTGEDSIERMAVNFEASMALDTVRNEYLLHRRIHQWFVDAAVGRDHRVLSERVYDELFLTPRSDPWLGMLPASTFAALEHGGVTE